MTKLELKQKLIAIRNGAMITPVLEELWMEIDKQELDVDDVHKFLYLTFVRPVKSFKLSDGQLFDSQCKEISEALCRKFRIPDDKVELDKGLIMLALFKEQDNIAQFFDDLIWDKTGVQVSQDVDYNEQYAWLFGFISDTIWKKFKPKDQEAYIKQLEAENERLKAAEPKQPRELSVEEMDEIIEIYNPKYRIPGLAKAIHEAIYGEAQTKGGGV